MGIKIVSTKYLDKLKRDNEIFRNQRSLRETKLFNELKTYKQTIRKITTNSTKMTKNEIVNKLKELEK